METPRRWDLDSLTIWLVSAFVLLIPLGEAALRWISSTSAGNEITDDRARFWIVNAITLTGFQSVVTLQTYPLAGRLLILLLTLIGIFFSMVVGGLAVVRILRLRYSDPQVVYSSGLICLVLILLGATALVQADRSPMDALILSASAFGNSGLVFSIQSLPAISGWQTHLVLLPLAVLGGLGLPVLMELVDLLRGQGKLSFHSQTVVRMTAGLYLLGLAASFLARVPYLESPVAARDVLSLAASSSALAVNCRSAGLPYEYAGAFPRLLQWMVIVLMIIGASPAGTAGGIKTTTVAELFRGLRRCLQGQAPGRPFGLALLWVGIYMGLAGIFFGLLLCTDRQLPPDRLAFETISALGNVGLSFDQVLMVTPGLDVLSGAMLLGRLAPLGMLWWMARTTENADLAIG